MSNSNDALSALLQQSLSNPAVNDPFSATAPPPNVPSPQETQNEPITGQLQEPQQQNAPQIAPQQPQRQPPQMGGMPLIARYLMDVVRGPKNVQDPNTGVISQQSRGDQTLNFLGEFLGNMAAGFQQAGHGPGANLRGAGAAMMAPYQRALQGYELGQQQQAQQAQIQGEQARTGLIGAQTAQANVETEIQQRRLDMMKGMSQGQDPVASLGTLTGDEQAVVNAARQEAALKGDQTPLLGAVDKIANMRAINARMGGNATIVPDANSSTGFSKVLRDRSGKVMDVQPNVAMPGLMGSTTSTQKWEQDSSGNWVQLPVTSTKTPILPAGAGGVSSGRAGRITGGSGGGAGGAVGGSAPAAGGARPGIAGPQALKPVIGVDSNGKQVMVGRGEAKQYGLTNVVDAPASDVSKAMSARQWLPLANAQVPVDDKGNPLGPPDQMGLLQLTDELDKRGALGPIASRWNDWLVGKVGTGTGNPETDRLMEAFRTKLGLSQTLLMNLHVGSRGGSYMMEHFEDLANGKKLNANILREGIKSELNYAEDRAMQPGGKVGGPPKGGKQPKASDFWKH